MHVSGLLLTAGFLAAQSPAQSPYDLNRVQPGKPAPDFVLLTGAAKTVRLSDLRGKNVILVFYRGQW